MNKLFGENRLEKFFDTLSNWAERTLFNQDAPIELGLIVICLLLTSLSAPFVRGRVQRLNDKTDDNSILTPILTAVADIVRWGMLLLVLYLGAEAMKSVGMSTQLVTLAVNLTGVWIVICIVRQLIKDPFWSWTLGIFAFLVAALNLADLLDPTIRLLDSIGITIGSSRVTIYKVLKGLALTAVLLWLAVLITHLFERQMGRVTTMTPSVRVLMGKIAKIILIAVALFTGVNAIGIDLTALAVFTGALGVGIGFGLQKVISNLVSGMILLMDRSVKPGDVISVGTTYGWVNTMGARYVSLLTRDGIEHLIPNEDLITQRVENWSYSNNLVRVKVPFGVHYKSDVHKVRALALEAAAETERVLADPKPVCGLVEFGDSSVNFNIMAWIRDPQEGVSNVKSAILFNLWDKLKENEIEIPYPQRDLHWRSDSPVPVQITGDNGKDQG